MTPHIVWTDLGDARMSADLPLSEIRPQGRADLPLQRESRCEGSGDSKPCDPKEATLVKVVFDEGGVLFGTAAPAA